MSDHPALTVEGGLLVAELIDRVAAAPETLKGQKPADFGLSSERLSDEIQAAFSEVRKFWDAFESRKARSKESPVSITRETLAIPVLEVLGFQPKYQRASLLAGDNRYEISHQEEDCEFPFPIHIVAGEQDLDSRVDGGGRSPHALVQDFLNRSESLWGIATNGTRWRLLRDSARIARPTYVEFDLQTIVESNLYSEFVLLWRLLHRTRFPRGETSAHECLLEQYHQQGLDEGGRVREHLRDGVTRAIEILGRGLFRHQKSEALREAVRKGELTPLGYYQELLRLIYRMLFLMVAEERRLLFDGERGSELHGIYSEHYSLTRLRALADRPLGRDGHTDLWRGILVTFGLFRDEDSAKILGLTPLDGDLFHESACSHLSGALCTNEDLLRAVRELSTFEEQQGRRRTGTRRRVNYGGLDVEELGSVYESLLEMQPRLTFDPADFTLGHSGERKTTGSYYTPPSLVAELIKSALEPVIADRLKPCKSTEDKEKALLHIKVCDPAAGSGHFLLAAARRLGKELARVRTGSEEPDPVSYRHAVRDVVAHCIYGVDHNPMAVELCKVALWLEAMDTGKPLSFLSHRIKRGNSLIGATPALLKKGIPDEAFKEIEGDDKEYVKKYKKKNKQERQAPQIELFNTDRPWERLGDVTSLAVALDAQEDDSVAGYRKKQEQYEKLVSSSGYLFSRLWADAWCAAFVWKKTDEFPYPVTEEIFRKIERNPHSTPKWMVEEIKRLAKQYGFFHWHLEFPDVFRVPGNSEKPENALMGLSGGFDVVLGNPPWEHTELKEQEFFASIAPEIAKATSARRKQMIKDLTRNNPILHKDFTETKRAHDAVSHFVRNTKRFPLCGTGRINTYAIFAELNRTIINPAGRVGCIIPSGIATDDTTKCFFQDLVETRALVSLYEFENEGFFGAGQGHMVRFALTTIGGAGTQAIATDFMFQGKRVEELRNEERCFALTCEEIALLNPNTRTCPIFRTRRDAEINKAIYRRVPVFIREGDSRGNLWDISFRQGLFNMSSDADLFRDRKWLEANGWRLEGNKFIKDDEVYVPLYEAKLVYQYTHRHGDFADVGDERVHRLPEVSVERLNDPAYVVQPCYWVPKKEVDARLADRWDRNWLLGWRDVTDARASARSVIASAIPRLGVGHNMPLLFASPSNVALMEVLLAIFSSFAFDYAARQKIGGLHLTYTYLNQLPVLPPNHLQQVSPWDNQRLLANWITPRIAELTVTSWDMVPFLVDLGWDEEDARPFKWNEQRRFDLRCELDAAFFHLYDISREDADYIMDTFPIVCRKDEAAHGEYRTKRVILEIYDEMAEAIRTGKSYQTRLDPPPADPSCAHPESTRPEWAKKPAKKPAKPPEKKAPPRKPAVPVRPNEVPITVFASAAYPSTDADRAICAVALAVVEQSGGLASMEHLDALLLAARPDWCKSFLDQKGKRALDTAVRSAPAKLFIPQGQSIHWKECRDYLERLNALTVARGNDNQPVGAGSALISVKASLSQDVDAIARVALQALDRIREFRHAPSSVPQPQRRAFEAFVEQGRAEIAA